MKKTSAAGGIFIGLVLVFLYAPILILAVYSFTEAANIGAIRSFSMHNYVTLFTTPELRDMILGTLALALGSACLATILGTIGAIGSFYSSKKVSSGISTVNQIPVINADVVTGFSICILLVVVLGISKDTYIPLVAGHVTLCAPFVFLSVTPKLKQMDSSIYEAALDLGATPWKALTKVIIPQIYPAILTGALLAFSMSLDDFVVSYFNAGPGINTISMYVESMKRYNLSVNAMATLFVVVVALILLLTNLVPIIKDKKAQKEEPQNV